jgi:hypothetical protein
MDSEAVKLIVSARGRVASGTYSDLPVGPGAAETARQLAREAGMRGKFRYGVRWAGKVDWLGYADTRDRLLP